MAQLKDIRKRIVSVKNTKKITKALSMISASKLFLARKNIEQSRPYNTALKEIVRSFYHKAPEHLEKFLIKRDSNKIAFLLFTSDRGLCGSLNSALCKELKAKSKENKVTLFIIGKKGKDFFKSENIKVADEHIKLKEIELKNLMPELTQNLVTSFLKEEYDEIHLAFNYFKNSLQQVPTIQQFLPLSLEDEDDSKKLDADFIYEPSIKEISQRIIPLYLENLCYLCLLDSFASEHATRMRVMDSATNNATDLIDKLQVQYNRARQASITTELTEIISGAESIN